MKKYIWIIGMTLTVVFLFWLYFWMFTSPSSARRTLHNAGYTEIDAGGYAFFKCSDDDSFKTDFSAKSATGVTVTGAVCSGWIKGNTIRLD